MKRLCRLGLPLTLLLLSGCASLRPHSPQSIPGAAVFWLPAGYEDDLVLEPGLVPPGSLAEFQLRTGLRGSEARHAFAGQFPGAEAEVEAYEQEWADCFAKTIWPGLRRHTRQPLVWQRLAEDPSHEMEILRCYRSSLRRLQRSIVGETDPQIRNRLQDLLFIQEIQLLRTQAIHHAALGGLLPAVERLAQVSEELPVNSRFRAWLEAQEEAESRWGDLAGREWYRLCHDEQESSRIHAGEWLVLPDPASSGLADGWQNQWPQGTASQPRGIPFADWLGKSHGQDSPVIWLGSTFAVLPQTSPDAPGEFVVNLRSVRGSVRAYLDGTLVGEYQAEPGQPHSCRFPLAVGNQPGEQSHALAIRIEAQGEPQATPILWHQPWLMVVPAKSQPRQ